MPLADDFVIALPHYTSGPHGNPSVPEGFFNDKVGVRMLDVLGSMGYSMLSFSENEYKQIAFFKRETE
eukprot:5357736-Prymnesium_polylepis.5